MSLFADVPSETSPWWYVGGMAVIGLSYGISKLYFYVRGKHRVFNQGLEKDRLEQQRQARREAAEEAWEVVDRLTKELESVNERVARIEARHAEAIMKMEQKEQAALDRAARCEAEHAHTTGRLSIIEAWARQRGLKIPPSGSASHTALPMPDEDK